MYLYSRELIQQYIYIYIYIYEQNFMLTQFVKIDYAAHQLRTIRVILIAETLFCHYNNHYCQGVLHLKQLDCM